MRSFQEMDKIIQKADQYLQEMNKAFESADWAICNRIKRELREMIDNYYHRQK